MTEVQVKKVVTFEDIRAQIRPRPYWLHALEVIDIIEEYVGYDPMYLQAVQWWLTDPSYSTIWLRDNVMEVIRYDPRIVEIGRQFNPTTEWHNTWMPLDSAMHLARNGVKTGE